jgi:hypothetical protein
MIDANSRWHCGKLPCSDKSEDLCARDHGQTQSEENSPKEQIWFPFENMIAHYFDAPNIDKQYIFILFDRKRSSFLPRLQEN